jgi:hypothetical protein
LPGVYPEEITTDMSYQNASSLELMMIFSRLSGNGQKLATKRKVYGGSKANTSSAWGTVTGGSLENRRLQETKLLTTICFTHLR